MIKAFILSLFILTPLMVTLSACSTGASSDTVYLKIEGMTCEPCAQTLTKKFNKEDTIESVKINWKKGTGKIVQKPNQRISDVTIEKIVDWSGFDLISIDRK